MRRVIGRSLGALVLLAIVAAGCAGGPSATFSPSGPCAADGRAPGAYPPLEALIPTTLGGQAPKTLDSGRNCSAANLGTLADHGVREVRFAGGVWPGADTGGVTMAVFQAPGLAADWIGEWYEASARAGRTTGNIRTTQPTVAGRPANRMDLVNGDSTQSVVTWPSSAADTVNVVIASDVPEARIQEAIAAFP